MHQDKIFPTRFIFYVGKLVKKMSNMGWYLFDCHFGVIFCFEKCEFKERDYFIWDPSYPGEGKYSISMRYPFLRKTIGVKAKHSKLNNNTRKKTFKSHRSGSIISCR